MLPLLLTLLCKLQSASVLVRLYYFQIVKNGRNLVSTRDRLGRGALLHTTCAQTKYLYANQVVRQDMAWR